MLFVQTTVAFLVKCFTGMSVCNKHCIQVFTLIPPSLFSGTVDEVMTSTYLDFDDVDPGIPVRGVRGGVHNRQKLGL